MRITEINWGNIWGDAPKDGYVLACFRQEVLFQRFDSSDSGLKERISGQQDTLLELHVFDTDQEYRLIRCESGDYIETVVSDEGELVKKAETEIKTETVRLESRYDTMMQYLQIVNYIHYNENGMLYVYNYRLAPVEGGR